jgi:hypothetical protein
MKEAMQDQIRKEIRQSTLMQTRLHHLKDKQEQQQQQTNPDAQIQSSNPTQNEED